MCCWMEPLAPRVVGDGCRERSVERDHLPTDAVGGTRLGFARAIQRRPLAAGHLQGPETMATTQRTTSLLWWGDGTTRSAHAQRSGTGSSRPPGWLHRGPTGTVRAFARARSSVGERCLHTAEVGGSIPPVPTPTNTKLRAGPPSGRGTGSFPVERLHGGAGPADHVVTEPGLLVSMRAVPGLDSSSRTVSMVRWWASPPVVCNRRMPPTDRASTRADEDELPMASSLVRGTPADDQATCPSGP
jgi:hypothetical protein